MMFSASAALGQSSALNPTVSVLPQATAPVPPECIDTASQPIQRAQIDDRPAPPPARPVDAAVPATSDLRSALAEAHAAAIARDRERFVAAHTRARRLVTTMPAGRERTAAAEALAALDDVARLWDYQFNTPAGSFFDETVQDGSLVKALAKYPGYEEFIWRHTIVANGTRYYPTRESMDFVMRVASERLTRIGIPVERQAAGQTPRAVARRNEPPRTPEPAQPSTTTARRDPAPAPATRRAGTATRTTSRAATTRTTKPVEPQRRAARRPASPPASEGTAPDEEPPLPSGVVSSTPPPSHTAAAATQTTTTAETATAGTDTVATSATETAITETTPEGEPAPAAAARPPDRRRNIILPLVLILIGVGVLIVLFRASS